MGELVADGIDATADCEPASAIGPAGTVYLCHPFLVHAAQRHRGAQPRFLAQPPLLPVGPLDADRPVAQAIRAALAR